jgi:hypothetical protein
VRYATAPLFSRLSGDASLTDVRWRGAATADFNNDGKLDVVVSLIGGRAELWENDSPATNTWSDVKSTGTRSNRDGIGARVQIANQRKTMTANAGYASSSLVPVHVGTGNARQVDIEILWPSGVRQTLRNVATNQVLAVREPEKRHYAKSAACVVGRDSSRVGLQPRNGRGGGPAEAGALTKGTTASERFPGMGALNY